MKVCKIEIMVLDYQNVGEQYIKEKIEQVVFTGRLFSMQVRNIESRDIGEWSDDNPLNFSDTCDAEFRRIFSPRKLKRHA